MFVLQNMIVIGRHMNFVIVIKRMLRNTENQVIKRNENEGIQWGKYYFLHIERF
jgi:hypothetical protein